MADSDTKQTPAGSTDPTTNYYKTKKTLLLFVGALLLSMVAGFKIDQEKISILPFELEHPDWLAHILFAVVVFYLFQFSLQWAAQLSDIQKNRFHRIDFLAITAITVASILYYAGWIGWPYIQKSIAAFLSASLSASRASALIAASEATKIIFVLVGGIVASLASKYIRQAAVSFGRSLRNKEAREDEKIMTLLKSKSWILNYNPAGPGKEKEISFKDDGTVGAGKNKNEHEWRVRNGLLEILDLKERIFSRFIYDDTKKVFVHTNDPDTLSIRSQTIRPK